MIPIYAVDEFKTIVEVVNSNIVDTIRNNETAALNGSKIELISYHHGSEEELLETLSQKDRTLNGRTLKYPFVYLQQDFTEQRGRIANIFSETPYRILFIHQTLSTYKIQDRYSKVFKPVLVPIYWEFMKQVALYPLIVQNAQELISHDYTERAMVGRDNIRTNKGEVLLNDIVDVIDVSNLKLKFYIKNC